MKKIFEWIKSKLNIHFVVRGRYFWNIRLLVFQDTEGIHCKLGYSYGYNCWDTIWPKKRPYYFTIKKIKITHN